MAKLHSVDSSTEQAAQALREAADQLGQIKSSSIQLGANLESARWTGLDKLPAAEHELDAARDQLADVADKVGIGAQIVRDAYLANDKVGNKSTVTDN